METKKCTKCGQEKPVSEFNKSAASKDGLQNYCKECKKVAAKAITKKTGGGDDKSRQTPHINRRQPAINLHPTRTNARALQAWV